MKHFQSTNETLPIILQKLFRLITAQKQQMKCKYLTQNKPNKIKNTKYFSHSFRVQRMLRFEKLVSLWVMPASYRYVRIDFKVLYFP